MAVVRTLIPTDVPSVLEALGAMADVSYVGDFGRLRALLEAALAGDAAAVVTVDPSGRPLGVALLALPKPGVAQLALLWVDAEYRRRGLARAMLSAFTPVWSDSVITAELPSGADAKVAAALLIQFAFIEVTGGGALDGMPTLWRTRRVRRTTGRASLAQISR
jgi:GNAT superfamily N-acetyltransferase